MITYKIGDANNLIKELPDNHIDLVITSPPYNVGINYSESFNDKKPIEEYYKFAFNILKEIHRVLKPGGRACIEIGGAGRCFPLSWIYQDCAFRNNLYLFSEIVLEHRKTNQCAWGSYLKADNVYTISNFHMLYVFFKETPTKTGKLSDITKEEFLEYTRGLWRINWSKHNGHPASFPREIPYRCMKLFGHVDDLILDPFCGTGTTLSVAKDINRNAIGYEINSIYEEIIQRNINIKKIEQSEENKNDIEDLLL